jgi:hypothetical protein
MKRSKCNWQDRASDAILTNLKGFAEKSVAADDRAPKRITSGSRRQATWTRPDWLDADVDVDGKKLGPAAA